MQPELRVVAVGASAGGLEPIIELFAHLPRTGRLAFVVVQHLSTSHRSLMVDLLRPRTELIVEVAEHDRLLEPDRVYLTPPGMRIEVQDDHLILTPFSKDHAPYQVIDELFHSLAAEKGPRSTAVVLSGSGADGAKGARSILREGGVTMVQDPDTAEYDGMPLSVLEHSRCDVVGSPAMLADAIVDLLDLPPTPRLEDPYRPEDHPRLAPITRMLQEAYGLHLSMYKSTMVRRRVLRRAKLTGFDDLQDYREYLKEHREELELLYADLLIGVTRFFRDTGAFEALRDHMQTRLDQQDAPTVLRAWVPACATGEEAYSVAILLAEVVGDPGRVQVFATDVHASSVRQAGMGVYEDDAIQSLGSTRRDQWFEATDDGRWRIRRRLRDRVTFATHDLLRDPPISRLDLICCRNVLIYFNRAGQQQALSQLVFALRTGGLLLLGPSESPAGFGDAVEVLERRWRLYRKAHGLSRPPRLTPRPAGRVYRAPVPTSRPAAHGPRPALLRAYDALLDTYAPPGLLVDASRQLQHVFGDGARLLRMRPGRPSGDVVEMVASELRPHVATALRKASQQHQPVHVVASLEEEPLQIDVRPLGSPHDPAYLITLGEAPPQAEIPSVDLHELDRNDALQQELTWTREALRLAQETSDASTEELQATNEELTASNEELQATNEELQSVNEELHTVNVEYREKNEELATLTTDLENLLRSTDMAVLFLDLELRVRRFTRAAQVLFHVRQGDEGRPMEQLCTTELHHQVLRMARQCLRDEAPLDQQVTFDDQSAHLIRLRRYVTRDGRTQGVVVTVVDVSTLHQLRQSAELQTRVLDMMPQGVAIWRLEDPADPVSFRLVYANAAADAVSSRPVRPRLGQTATEISPESVRLGVFHRFAEVVATGEAQTRQVRYTEGRDKPAELRQVVSAGPGRTVVVVWEDVTREVEERDQAEATRRMQSVGELAGAIAHDLNNLLGVILMATGTMELEGEAVEDALVVQQAASSAADLVAQLLAYSKRRPVAPRSVDLEAFFARIQPIVDSMLGSRLTFVWSVEASTPPIRVDASALEQVILNLAVNARNAVAGRGGTFTVEAGPELSEREVGTEDEGGAQMSGGQVRILVRDDGPGMATEVRERCFEPYFSTQPKGLGTGMGLASVKGVVEQADGTISVDSVEGQGTCFTLRFPPAGPPTRAARRTSLPETPKGARILVVDDEEILRRTISRHLTNHGYLVQEAAGGAAALEKLRRDTFDLMITDVLMPGMNGPQLAEKVRSQLPHLPVLFISGYADHIGLRNTAWELDTHRFLEKPFQPADLLRAVLSALTETD